MKKTELQQLTHFPAPKINKTNITGTVAVFNTIADCLSSLPHGSLNASFITIKLEAKSICLDFTSI